MYFQSNLNQNMKGNFMISYYKLFPNQLADLSESQQLETSSIMVF